MYTDEETELLKYIWHNQLLEGANLPDPKPHLKGDTVEEFAALVLNKSKKSIIAKLTSLGLKKKDYSSSLTKKEIVDQIAGYLDISDLTGLEKATRTSLKKVLEALKEYF